MLFIHHLFVDFAVRKNRRGMIKEKIRKVIFLLILKRNLILGKFCHDRTYVLATSNVRTSAFYDKINFMRCKIASFR